MIMATFLATRILILTPMRDTIILVMIIITSILTTTTELMIMTTSHILTKACIHTAMETESMYRRLSCKARRDWAIGSFSC
jgi:hypothetical protein